MKINKMSYGAVVRELYVARKTSPGSERVAQLQKHLDNCRLKVIAAKKTVAAKEH